MKEIRVQTAIIGAGSAGLKAYEEAKKHGVSAVIIDPDFKLPAIFRSGYLPLDILRAIIEEQSSSVLQDDTPITMYGMDHSIRLKFSTILQDLRERRRNCSEKYMKNFSAIAEQDKIYGHASFEDQKHLLVPDTGIRITAETFVIATGSRPYIPSCIQPAGSRAITCEDLFELQALPKSIAILGAGSTALELGQILTRLGVKTVIFGQRHLWHFTDIKISEIAEKCIGKSVVMFMNSEITEISSDDNGVTIYYLDQFGKEGYIRTDYILAAAGRIPSFSKLHTENAGISPDIFGAIPADPNTRQTKVPHIFAAGSVAAQNTPLERSLKDGAMAGRNAARYPGELRKSPWLPLTISFTTPNFAIVGKKEEERRRRHDAEPYIIGEASFQESHWAEIHLETAGMIHLYFSLRTQKLLGAELALPMGATIAQFLAFSIALEKTLPELLGFSFYKPSPLEIVQLAVKNASTRFRELETDRKIQLPGKQQSFYEAEPQNGYQRF